LSVAVDPSALAEAVALGVSAADAIPVTPSPAPNASAPAVRPSVILFVRDILISSIRRVKRLFGKNGRFAPSFTQRCGPNIGRRCSDPVGKL
jgi:hypothetical protein